MQPDEVNTDEVARLVLGELEGDAAPEADDLSDRDAALAVIREEVRGLVAALETDDSVVAPADLVRKTAELLHQRGLAALIAAVLVYDSRRRPQVGFRSSTAGCHLTFDADGETIDLRVEPSGDQWSVRGQIGEDRTEAAGIVHLVATEGSEVIANAPIDPFGYFEIEAPAGRYDVQVSMPNATIVLEHVQIG